MTRTYHQTVNVILAVEAGSASEAKSIIKGLTRDLQSAVPYGVRLAGAQGKVQLGEGR